MPMFHVVIKDIKAIVPFPLKIDNKKAEVWNTILKQLHNV